nr:DUF1349 domain-containing protein [uncultured Aminipila sp.]
MNIFNDINDKLADESLCWKNKPDKWAILNNNQISITAPESTDFFNDPGGEVCQNAPFLFTYVTNDDFVCTTRVSVDFKSEYDTGCIMLVVDEENWCRVGYEVVNGDLKIVSVVNKATSDDCDSQIIGDAVPYLRITKKGNLMAMHYSLDGKAWPLVRYFNLARYSDKMKLGVTSLCLTGKACTSKFDFLEYEAESVEDILECK